MNDRNANAQPPAPMSDPAPVQLFRMINGMWVSQIVSAFAELSVADAIHRGVAEAGALARETKSNPDALYRLMRAAMTIGLVTEGEGKTFALTSVGECLRTDTQGSLRSLAIAEAAHGHWAPWGRLVDAIQSGQPTAVATLGMPAWEYYAKTPAEALHFAQAMGNLSAMAGIHVTAAFDATPYKRIADIGGSQGILLQGVLGQARDAKGILFDLPEVIEAARPFVAQSPAADRIELVGGSFFETVPAGADLYLLKHILHDWDDAHCTTILGKIREGAGRGGRLLIVEFMLPDHPQPSPVHLMDLNMLVMLGGRERNREEFRTLLGGAGWTLTEVRPTQGMFTILLAEAQ